jgi:hypothetical protein
MPGDVEAEYSEIKKAWITDFVGTKYKTWARAFESLVMMGVEPAERPYAPGFPTRNGDYDPAYNQEVHKALVEKGWLTPLRRAAWRELRKTPYVLENSTWREAKESDAENDIYVGCVLRVYGKMLVSFLAPTPKGWW